MNFFKRKRDSTSVELLDIKYDKNTKGKEKYSLVRTKVPEREKKIKSTPILQFFKDDTLEENFLNFFYLKKLKLPFFTIGFTLSIFISTVLFLSDFYWTLWWGQRNLPLNYVVSRIIYHSMRFIVLLCSVILAVTSFVFGFCIKDHYIFLFERIVIVFLMLVIGCSAVQSVVSDELVVILSLALCVHYGMNFRFYFVLIFTFFHISFVFIFSSLLSRKSFVGTLFQNLSLIMFNLGAVIVNWFLEKNFRLVFIVNTKVKKIKENIFIENERKNEILRNIFPQNIINAIKNEINYKKYYEDIPVYLSDFENFTKFSSEIKTKDLIRILDRIYTQFDQVCLNFGVEVSLHFFSSLTPQRKKIKTIGDAYFAVAFGFEKEISSKRMILASFKIYEVFEEIKEGEGIEILSLRTGIGLGSCFVTVLGKEFLTFDCYGSSVEETKILERTCERNCVQVSKKIFFLLENEENSCFEFAETENGYNVSMKSERKIEEIQFESGGNDVTPFEFSLNEEKKTEKSNFQKRAIEFISEKFLLLSNFRENFIFVKESYFHQLIFLRCYFFVSFCYLLFFSIFIFLEERVKIYKIVVLSVLILSSIIISVIFLIFSRVFYVGFIFTILNYVNSLVFFMFAVLTSDYSKENFFKFHNLVIVFVSLFILCPALHFLIKSLVMLIISVILLFVCSINGINFALPINFVIVIVITMIGMYSYHYSILLFSKKKKEIERDIKILEGEAEQNSFFLRSTLPEEVIDKLVDNSSVNYEYVNGCALFCLVHNLNFEEKNIGSKCVDFINNLFTKFDQLSREENCSKIKSVGTHYLVVSGLKNQNEGNLELCVYKTRILDLAKKMSKFFTSFLENYDKDVFGRCFFTIGIHSGNFSSGVVGKSKFLFDVFGHTINIAHRMAETSERNRIQVTENFKNGISKDHFFVPRGRVDVKGIGGMKSFFVLLKEFQF